jgi:hypothetical protein
MSVRAKFRVDDVKGEGDGKQIVMSPVVGNGDPESENSQFFKYTPSGVINLSTVNEAAAAQFKIGAEVYVDFTPIAPAAVESSGEPGSAAG